MAISKATRKQFGRFDTPRPLSQSLANWAIRTHDARVLEPGCGGGVFLRSAEKKLKSLGAEFPIEQVDAFDIDHEAIRELIRMYPLLKARVKYCDFLSQKSHTTFDCVIGNPPYVSLHQMSHQQRDTARASIQNSKFTLDAKSSLWAYFVTHSCASLKPAGRLAFVLSQSLLHVDYARSLLKQISKQFRRVDVISIRERCFLEEGTKERVAVLLADGWGEKGDGKVRLHEAETIIELEYLLKNHGEILLQSKNMSLNGHSVPYVLGRKIGTISKKIEKLEDSLGDYLTIKIGVVTGANKFFVLNEETRRKHQLPANCFAPVLSKFPELNGLSLKESDWKELHGNDHRVLMLQPNSSEHRKRVIRYLSRFPEEEKSTNATFGKRLNWHVPEMGEIPDGFIRCMGNCGPTLLLNDARVNCTNTIHRVYFHESVSRSQRMLLAISLWSTISQLSAEFEGRSYGSGVLKLEPSEAKRIKVLMPKDLHPSTIRSAYLKLDSMLRKRDYAGARNFVDSWLLSKTHEKLPSIKNVDKYLLEANNRRNAVISTHAV